MNAEASSNRVPLTVEELARLTAEVSASSGPGYAPVTKRFNEMMIYAPRKGGGRVDGELAGIDLLLPTTTGRKSGRAAY